MAWVYIGCVSFLLFILYDYNQIKSNSIYLKPLFLCGFVVLSIATIKLSVTAFDSDYTAAPYAVAVFYLFSALNLLLLCYTLFFAIPFDEAYVQGSKQKICREGIYALCRHPGVIFLAGFYLFLGLALCRPVMLLAGAAFTALNLLYVWLQDIWFFPLLFDGYEEYKKEAPFLMPNAVSIRRCFHDLAKRYGKIV